MFLIEFNKYTRKTKKYVYNWALKTYGVSSATDLSYCILYNALGRFF